MSGVEWFNLVLWIIIAICYGSIIWGGVRHFRRGRPALNCRRNKVGAWLGNLSLRMTTPEYRAFIRGSIEYGMRSAARDQAEDRDPPDDWRPALPGSDPYPVTERLS